MSISSIPISFKLIETESQIINEILKALFPEVEKYFNRNIDSVADAIGDILVKYIVQQPEYTSLTSGTLQYELGIPNPVERMNEILGVIKSGAIVKRKPLTIKSSGISGGIKIQMVKKDFSDLLSLGSATLITEKGDQLNWLEWLLLAGDTIIVSEHSFILGPSPYSRTGFGIMKESVGGIWRIPPEYAGTIGDNWITRAIDASAKEIENTIEKLFQY
jgi:hypothetical protein